MFHLIMIRNFEIYAMIISFQNSKLLQLTKFRHHFTQIYPEIFPAQFQPMNLSVTIFLPL